MFDPFESILDYRALKVKVDSIPRLLSEEERRRWQMLNGIARSGHEAGSAIKAFERREMLRFPYRARVCFQKGPLKVFGNCRDIGYEGIGIESAEDLPVGCITRVIVNDSEDNSYTFWGKVIWVGRNSNRRTYGMGIAFLPQYETELAGAAAGGV